MMKSQLYEQIEYPDSVHKNITDKIKQDGENYICKNCRKNPSFKTTRRNTLIRHIKAEIGYYTFRCTFCDEKSNDPHTLINHYALTHGIPSNWCNLTDFLLIIKYFLQI